MSDVRDRTKDAIAKMFFNLLFENTMFEDFFFLRILLLCVIKEDQQFLAVVRPRAYDVCEVYQSSTRR